MKYVDIRDLPPCSFSPQCLRLLEDLDIPPMVSPFSRLAYIEDLQDERHLRQLRSHVPGCPTCSALLVEARRIRTQQRLMLYHFMVANERRVPATSGAIFEAIRREHVADEAGVACVGETRGREERRAKSLFAGQEATPVSLPVSLRFRPVQYRRLFRNMITLATVAAVLLAAIGLLNRFTIRPGAVPGQSSQAALPNQVPPPGSSPIGHGWDSVLIGLTVFSAAGLVSGLSFYSYNTSDGQFTTLMSASSLTEMNADGISSDGQWLLYDATSPSQQKTYATLSTVAGASSGVHPIYQTPARQGGNALWMDTTDILVQNGSEVRELNVQTHTSEKTWSLKTSQLTFYHQPYLYFLGADEQTVSTLYRANLTQADPIPQRVAVSAPDTRFLLSVDGTTIFYSNREASGSSDIYAVDSDGAHFRLLRKGGIPIGYAADDALMVMEQVRNRFQVVKLGTTPGAPEQVILANAAPNAASLCKPSDLEAVLKVCDENVALAPYGHGLLLHAYYANGTSSLVYDNLDAGSVHTIRGLPAGTRVQLPGWSKGTSPTALSGQMAGLCA